jgi:hypothetical protein
MADGEPVSVVRINDLTEAERDRIEHKIIADNPKYDPNGSGLMLGVTDYSYETRYKAYRKNIPIFMSDYARRLERTFNQARFRMKIANTGKVQAENLLVEVTVSGGWLHDRYAIVSPAGPIPPKPNNKTLLIPPIESIITRRVGRHEFSFKDAPNWGPHFSVTCEDFRHGQNWNYKAIVGLDPRAPETTISVSVTASNFRGKVQKHRLIDRRVETVRVSKVIELNSLEITKPTPIDGLIQGQDFEAIDLKAFALDDND